MSDSDTRTVSLQDIARKYSEALQHLSDLTVYLWAGSRAVSEQGYAETARSVPGLPISPFRLSLENVRDFGGRVFFKHSLNEVLSLTGIFLEDIRKLSGLIIFNAARAKGTEDLATLAAKLNTPAPADLAGRMKAVSDRLGQPVPLALELLSIIQLAGLHFQQNGEVGEGHAFELKLKRVEPPTEEGGKPGLGDYRRTWNEKERVVLSEEEHAAIFTTISIFFNATLEALQEFAKVSGLAPEPADS